MARPTRNSAAFGANDPTTDPSSMSTHEMSTEAFTPIFCMMSMPGYASTSAAMA